MNTPKKKWWKSKTILSGIGTILIGVISIVTGDIGTGSAAVITGIGTIFGRVTATKEISTPKTEP